MKHVGYAAITVVVLVAAGCASNAAQEAVNLDRQGRTQEGIAELEKAVRADPHDPQLRMAEQTLRERSLTRALAEATHFEQVSDMASATTAYRRALELDPSNAQARDGIAVLQRHERHDALLQQARQLAQKGRDEDAIKLTRKIIAEDPANAPAKDLEEAIEGRTRPTVSSAKMASALDAAISLEFKEASLSQVFEILSRTSGLNFVFDKDLKTSQKTTIFVKDTTVKQALDVLLITNQLEQRVLGDNMILIYPNTPAKLKDYQALRVRTFFLSNADVESVANTLKTILKTRDITIDKQRSMIVMRDTPDAVRMAERLVALHDLPEPEAMLEVEILEVNRDLLSSLGVKPPGQLSLSPLASGTGSTVTLQDLLHLKSSGVGVTVSPLIINAQETNSDIKTLANPRIRVKNRETAKILIGDRVPNITSTSTSTGFVSDSVQYLDVGLKLEIVPVITVDGEVSIKIGLEVSNIASQVTTNSGTTAYQISTRTASTVLRLKNNENQILAGLISDADRRNGGGLPGLARLPIVGRLFGSTDNETSRSEIVLSITPRIVRNVPRQSLAMLDFDSGTESDLREAALASMGDAGASNSSTAITAFPEATPLAIPASSTPIPSGNQSAAATTNISASSSGGAVVTANQAVGTTLGSSSLLTWQGATTAKAGDTFLLQLSAAPSAAVTTIGYQIDFDPTRLAVVGITEGDFLKQGGAATNFTSGIDSTQGHISVSNGRTAASDPGTSVAGTAAILTLRALTAGDTTQLRVEKLSLTSPGGRAADAAAPAPLTVSVTP